MRRKKVDFNAKWPSNLIVDSLIGDIKKNIQNGHVLSAAKKTDLMKKHRFDDELNFMVTAVNGAQDLPHASISNYRVPIVGKERETGDLIFGGNLEFAGSALGLTVHAEQFLFARAFHRGHSIESFALEKPTPCGHCRQFILEFAGGKSVRVQNSAGLDFRLGDLLPFNFGPEQLGENGIVPGKVLHKLKISTKDQVTLAALIAANLSYTPYSKTPSGIALQTKDEIFVGSTIENAAFNPSLMAIQSALINLVAGGEKWTDIRRAVLVQGKGKIDQSEISAQLLAQIAPKAKLEVF